MKTIRELLGDERVKHELRCALIWMRKEFSVPHLAYKRSRNGNGKHRGAKAVVFIVKGIFEGRYSAYYLKCFLEDLGYEVHIFGRSRLIDFSTLGSIRKDATTLAGLIKKQAKGRPVYVIGRSRGAIVAYLVAKLGGPELNIKICVGLGASNGFQLASFLARELPFTRWIPVVRDCLPGSDVITQAFKEDKPKWVRIHCFVGEKDIIAGPPERSKVKGGISTLLKDMGHVEQIYRKVVFNAIVGAFLHDE